MPSQKTGKEILSYIKTSYPMTNSANMAITSISTRSRQTKIVGSDYGWEWLLIDTKYQVTQGKALDYGGQNDYDIEIVSKDGSNSPNSTYVIRIYPNRMKNLRIRCKELVSSFSASNVVNGNRCYYNLFDSLGLKGNYGGSWTQTNLPGKNNKRWEKPDLGSITLLKNLYPTINDLTKNLIYIAVPLFTEGNGSIGSGAIDYWRYRAPDAAAPFAVDSQILKKSPLQISTGMNWRTSSYAADQPTIQMYIKSIVEKTEPFNLAKYFQKNVVLENFLNIEAYTDYLEWRGPNAAGSINADNDILEGFQQFLKDNTKYSANKSLAIGAPWPSYQNECKDSVSIPCCLTPDVFFNYVKSPYFQYTTPRDVEEIAYWELELVDPTEISSTPIIIPPDTVVPIQKVNPILKSDLVPFDRRGILPFDNYDSTTSAIYNIQKFDNSQNLITIYHPLSIYENQPYAWKRFIGTDPAQLVIKSVPTVAYNTNYNVNTIALIYSLDDSIQLGGTDDSLLTKQGYNRFGTGAMVEVSGLTLSPTVTDPTGQYIKYRTNNGEVKSVTLKSLLNNTYVHYVSRYKEYSTIKNKMVQKELIVLSNTAPNITMLPTYLDKSFFSTNKLTYAVSKDNVSVQTRIMTVSNIGYYPIYGTNPFTASSFVESAIGAMSDAQLSTIARYLGAGVLDDVNLTMFPVGMSNDIIVPNLNESINFDKDGFPITSLGIDNTKRELMWYVDMQMREPRFAKDRPTTLSAYSVKIPVVEITPTPTCTATNTPTNTPSVTATKTSTPTSSVTPTCSLSCTQTSTVTPTNTPTTSVTPTKTPTNTPTSSITPTNTPTPTVVNLSNDPFFNNVSLLMYSSGEGQYTTYSGNAGGYAIQTVNFKDYSQYRHQRIGASVAYGSKAVEITSNGFHFNYGSSLGITPTDKNLFRFGNKDFTIEARIYIPNYYNNPYGTAFLTTDAYRPAFRFSIGGGFKYYNGRTDTITYLGNPYIPPMWNHVAFSRENGVLRSFLNGVLITSVNDSSILEMDNSICIGGDPYNVIDEVYLNDIRVTNGVARYNRNFTPPTFPGTESVIATPLPTPTATPTLSITPSITASPTPTLTSTATLTATGTPTVTPTNTITSTKTPTTTNTCTPSITASKTGTPTATATNTQTPTTTTTLTPTPTTTPSLSPTSTITVTPTSTLTRTATPTQTCSPTPSATKAATAYAENVDGVLSNIATNPTFINLTTGRNRLSGSIVGGSQDYLRFSVNSGLQLENMVLVSYTAAPSASNSLSLKLGSIWNVSDNTVATDTIDSSKVGSGLLSITNNTSLTQTNYSLAIDGDSASYIIDIYLSIIPPTQTPTNTRTPTPTSTITLTPTNTSTTTLTPTPTTTTTTTATGMLTPTPTPTTTGTLTATPTNTPTVTSTPTTTSTITCSPTTTPSNTASVTPTPSQRILVNNTAEQVIQWGIGSTLFPAVTSNIIVSKNNCNCECK